MSEPLRHVRVIRRKTTAHTAHTTHKSVHAKPCRDAISFTITIPPCVKSSFCLDGVGRCTTTTITQHARGVASVGGRRTKSFLWVDCYECKSNPDTKGMSEIGAIDKRLCGGNSKRSARLSVATICCPSSCEIRRWHRDDVVNTHALSLSLSLVPTTL